MSNDRTLTSKKRVTLQSNRFGEFDLDELVNRLCHSHAPKPHEEDLYNAQVAILKLAEMLRASPETCEHPPEDRRRGGWEWCVRCGKVTAEKASIEAGACPPFDKALNDQIEAVGRVIQQEAASDPQFPVRGLANYAGMAERIIRAVNRPALKAVVSPTGVCPTGEWPHKAHKGKCMYCGAPMNGGATP